MQNLEEWRTKLGALLESIVRLSVQICKSIQASDFADALRNENLEVDVFMQKLKRILDLYKSPDTEFPGIRRVTVELIIWMVQSSSSYLEVFFQHQKAMQMPSILKKNFFSIHGISVLLQINITLYVKALNYSVLFVSKKKLFRFISVCP